MNTKDSLETLTLTEMENVTGGWGKVPADGAVARKVTQGQLGAYIESFSGKGFGCFKAHTPTGRVISNCPAGF